MSPETPENLTPHGLFAEWRVRHLLHDAESIDALCAAHPDHAKEIRRLHDAWHRESEPLEAFLKQYWADKESRCSRELSEYLAMFPGDEVNIAREFVALQEDQEQGTKEDDGRRIGPYRTMRELGRGGQGIVYLAQDTRLDRLVALKVLRGLGPQADELLLRFKREASAAAKLDHPGICAVYDAEVTGGIPYIAMRYIEGDTLARRIADTQRERSDDLSTAVALTSFDLSEDDPDISEAPSATTAQDRSDVMRAVRMAENAARVLHAVHEAGIIHRDIKPGNVMIAEGDQPVIMDFGLARDQESDLQTLTQSGDLFGTPAYMSPEQLTAQRIRLDRRTDVWSLGVVLYECVTLRRPFEAPTREALYKQILTKDPPGLRRMHPGIDKDLVTVIQTALEKDPDRRYQTALDFAEDLRRVAEREPIAAKPASYGTRILRWAQRNPSAAVAVCALIVGTILSTFFALTSASNLRDWERLADARILSDLTREANEDLWPAHPNSVAPIERWLADARDLARRADEHRAALAALRSSALDWTEPERERDRAAHAPELATLMEIRIRAGKLRERERALRTLLEKLDSDLATLNEAENLSPRDELRVEKLEERKESLQQEVADLVRRCRDLEVERERLQAKVEERLTWTFSDSRDQIRHDGLRDLVRGLEDLGGGDSPGAVTIASLEARLSFARTVRERTVDGEARNWEAAVERIARNPIYNGLQVSPQLGLVPLGPDPGSTLEEFAHLQTGQAPRRHTETGRLEITEESGLVFVLIPGGSFTMGAQATDPLGDCYDPDAKPDEGPPHSVILAPYLLSKYEMTQGQWLRFTGRNPSQYSPGSMKVTLRNPVEQVSWKDCEVVLRRLGLLLPTESQWEYACRAGTTTPWWTASGESLRRAANLADRAAANAGATWAAIEDARDFDDGHPVHAPAGAFRANAFGLHDMHGNVWEWCRDWWGNYDRPPRTGDGLREGAGARLRVGRGGSFYNPAASARSAFRGTGAPSRRRSRIGVRPSRRIQSAAELRGN